MTKSNGSALKIYGQLLLIIVSAGSILPLVYLRQSYEVTIIDVFQITQAQLRYCASTAGIVFFLTYIPGGWLADRYSARNLLSFSLLSTAALGLWFSSIPSYQALLIIFGGWGITTGLTFWAAHIKLVTLLATKEQQGRFFGLLDGGRGMVEASLATVAIAIFAYIINQSPDANEVALQNVIFLYVGVLLILSPLVYWLLEEISQENTAQSEHPNHSWQKDLKETMLRKDIWLCAICIVSGMHISYAVISFSGHLQNNFGYTAVTVGYITMVRLWMRPIASIAAGFIGDWSSPEKVLSILLVMASLSLAIMVFLPPTAAIAIVVAVVLIVALMTYGVKGVYWATLDSCNVPNRIKGLAIGVISMIGYAPEIYLPLASSKLLAAYPGALGYQIYYLCIAISGLGGAYAAYLLIKPTQRNVRASQQSVGTT